MLALIPAEGSALLAFTVECTGNWTAAVGTVSGGAFVSAESAGARLRRRVGERAGGGGLWRRDGGGLRPGGGEALRRGHHRRRAGGAQRAQQFYGLGRGGDKLPAAGRGRVPLRRDDGEDGAGGAAVFFRRGREAEGQFRLRLGDAGRVPDVPVARLRHGRGHGGADRPERHVQRLHVAAGRVRAGLLVGDGREQHVHELRFAARRAGARPELGGDARGAVPRLRGAALGGGTSARRWRRARRTCSPPA